MPFIETKDDEATVDALLADAEAVPAARELDAAHLFVVDTYFTRYPGPGMRPLLLRLACLSDTDLLIERWKRRDAIDAARKTASGRVYVASNGWNHHAALAFLFEIQDLRDEGYLAQRTLEQTI